MCNDGGNTNELVTIFMAKTWGIIGLGWLGSELARRLALSEQEYWGTNRQNFQWARDQFPVHPCDVLLLNTPPLTSISPQDFVDNIHSPSAQKIIFISSIGVYGSLSGTITEKTKPCPNTKNGIWLYEVEQLLLEKFTRKLIIIRPGGLIGGLRHPVISLAKKPWSIVRDGFINLIHRNDLVEIILTLSKQEEVIPVVNAVSPYHPLKSNYYDLWSRKLNLASLQFSVDAVDSKMVNSEILEQLYPEWLCLELDTL